MSATSARPASGASAAGSAPQSRLFDIIARIEPGTYCVDDGSDAVAASRIEAAATTPLLGDDYERTCALKAPNLRRSRYRTRVRSRELIHVMHTSW